MQAANGKSVLEGIAIGPLRVIRRAKTLIREEQPPAGRDPEKELERFEAARFRAIEQQKTLYDKALAEAGDEIASVFSIHAMMLEDQEFMDSIRELIVTGPHCAEYAVRVSGDKHAAVMARLEDPYLAARSADIEDVTQTLLDVLTGRDPDTMQGDTPAILMAEDLSPSEIVRLDKQLLLGFVTRSGSASSHTAILARSMNIPALVQCGAACVEWDGCMAILDGHTGCLYVEPSPKMLEIFQNRQKEDRCRQAMLAELRGKPNVTLDGVQIGIEANIGGVEDVASAEANDADGVGLFRSEFLYLNRNACPTEDEQFAIYKQVLRRLAPRRVVVRTCDLGADKTPEYMQLAAETNPALGYRAVRICLTRPDFFKTQLRALLRAARYGRLAVMFPMLTGVKELQDCKALLAKCREELTAEGVPVGPVEVGAMIETPAAALCADELAENCEFFSIGTNDLLQYTCALDRQNENLEPFVDLHHPALLRLIQMAVEAAHRHGIPATVCGELGADLSMTEWFLRLGVDALSVNPMAVLPLRETIRRLDLSADAPKN